MKLSDFDYPLPKELIALAPAEPRDSSKLLVVHRKGGLMEDRRFSDIKEYLSAGDVLVLNNTKVFPARLLGRKKNTGGKAEVLLLEPSVKYAGRNVWRCLIQPSPKEGQIYDLYGSEAAFLGRDEEEISLVEFKNDTDVKGLARIHGAMPLPPYIKREAQSADKNSYQTVYAEKEGAAAAPTAGLHFTRELLAEIKSRDVNVVFLTLHVGYGTFKTVQDLDTHRMPSERFEVSEDAAAAIQAAKAAGKKVWAVGTTTLRVLETCVQNKKLIAGKGETDLFIKEPFEFEAADGLITNFHLPKTTLLLLVSAFMGEPLRKQAYDHAIQQRYRFYSYGDAMLII